MKEHIIAGILFAISVFSFWMAIRSFMERGFLFNNAYLFASPKERERMNKGPYYRQSAIVFLLLGLIFALNGIQVLCKAVWIFPVVMLLAVVAVVYAVVSDIVIEKNKKG